MSASTVKQRVAGWFVGAVLGAGLFGGLLVILIIAPVMMYWNHGWTRPMLWYGLLAFFVLFFWAFDVVYRTEGR